MKRFFTSLMSAFLFFITYSAKTQITPSSQWTWVKGDNTADQPGVYGTQGTADAANKPGARPGSVAWTDASGNFWLFGGYGDKTDFNDLWKFTPSTNQWTWVKGDNTTDQPGVYGTQGTADAANKPGARSSSVNWTDASGNFWLFGGQGYAVSGYGILNDLWKFNPSTNNWTWVKGDNTINQSGINGTQGTADALNKPGGRRSSVAWTDASGNLWLFGGLGKDGSNSDGGYLNDLWKYNPSTNQWTWVKGDNIRDQLGIYGTQGTTDAANKPGSREGSVSWRDVSGNLWIFGGYGFAASNIEVLNDLWKYNPSINQWTWVKGDNTVNQPGVYGTKGTANAANNPGARQVSIPWTDASGDFWLFGGYAGIGLFNDLWKYNTSTNQWTWVKGDNTTDQPGVYGTQGTADAANKPGARFMHATWTDASDNFWLFGGYGHAAGSVGSLNDLWRLSAVAANQPPVVTTSTGNTSYSNGTPVAVDAAITVSDADNANLAGATIKITTNFQATDTLQFADQNSITGSYNTTTGVLSLSGSATVANYEAAFRSIQFFSKSLTPNTASRTISLRAFDGTDSSNTAAKTVTISCAGGDTSVFPLNVWNQYGYTGRNIDLTGITYNGLDTFQTITFDTRSHWNLIASPSASATWRGCSVPADFFTLVLKRKGFAGGFNTLRLPYHDDEIRVYKNGRQVYDRGCCNTNETIYIGKLGADSTMEIRLGEATGGAGLNAVFSTTALNSGSISGTQNVCGSATPTQLTNTQAAFGGDAPISINYQWQDSVRTGVWTNISGANGLNYQPPAAPLDTTYYKRKAMDSEGVIVFSNVVSITPQTVQGNPTVFPIGTWNFYTYDGADINLSATTYKGFYNRSTLNFNTLNDWCGSCGPSQGSGYQGCSVGVDNFSLVAKRKGFQPGTYTLNIPGHDDDIRIYKNGVQVFEHIGCCDSHSNISLGTMDANTTLEIRLVERGGFAYMNILFSNVAPTLNAIADTTVLEDAPQVNISLAGITAGEGETQTLAITTTSSNPSLIPNPTVSYTSANTTGSLSFTPVANANGTAIIRVRVKDNGGTANGGVDSIIKTFTVTVTPVNDAPTLDALTNTTILEDAGTQTVNLTGITSGVNESQTLTITATSNNSSLISNPTLTYTSANTTGTLSYTPNADSSGTATIQVRVKDNGGIANAGVDTLIRIFNVSVTAVNDAPVITSDGGGATATKSVAENNTAVTTVTATDVDNTTITYSKNGGADTAKFSINATTGVLTFITAPNFEAPTDADGNNTYIVTVRASDGTSNDDQEITVRVFNTVDNAPAITSPGNGESMNTKTPMYVGNAEALSEINIFVDGVSVGFTNADGSKNWNYRQPASLPDGSHNVRITSSAGGTSLSSNTVSFMVTSGSVLPVTMVNVKAYHKTGGIQVEWTTLTEINADRFEVERSLNGQTFSTIGSVQAKGNSSRHNYQWLDSVASSGTNYYRIKNIDKDGSVQFSNVVKLNTGIEGGVITVHPNPVTNNTISLQFAKVERGRYAITLSNKLGQQLYRSVIEHNGGSATQTLNLPVNLSRGVYQLQVIGDEMRMTKQLIKN